jgi:thiol-disulfide isomerase/thioredoxin
MKKTMLLALLLIAGSVVLAQNKKYDISKDKKNGELVFNGPITFDDLNSEPSFTWLKSGAEEYRPDEKAIGFLRDRLRDYTIVVFLGTWCDDSHYLIPKFEKVLQMTGYPAATITMFGADREKTTKNGEEKKYDITLVPTIILYKNGKEAGRITETVQKSIEVDLAKIINQ